MQKTGSLFRLLLIALFAGSLLPPYAQAQNGQRSSVDVEASVSEARIKVGDRISLTIEISGKDFNSISRPRIPQLRGFRLLSNTPSTSRSYRFVNGRSSISYSYTYYLMAEKPGSLIIPPISVKVDGKTHQTGPIKVSVAKGSQQNQKRNTPDNSGGSDRENIYLEMKVSTKNPVPGEQIVSSVVLYFRHGISVMSFQPVPGWKAQGFWKERLENTRPEAKSVIIDGVRYKKATLVEYALFPTRSGSLTLSPYKVALAIRTRGSGRDPFSSFFGARRQRIQLKTDSVQIDVQSLPPIDDARYIGAVGTFDISRSINTREAKVGQSIELTTRIEGTGNIPLIGKPRYDLPTSFETYEPQTNSTISKDGQSIKGKKIFTDVLIPRKTGTFTIPAVKVAYYNTRQQGYNVKYLPKIEIEVTRGAALADTRQTGGIPIRPITRSVSWHTPASLVLTSQWWFWAGLALPSLLLLVGFWQRKYREKLRTDRNFARAEHAWKQARERLQQAKVHGQQGEVKEVYSTLHQAITAFIGDRLGLPEAGLSDDRYVQALDENEVDEEIIASVRQFLQRCATIRYAPDPNDEQLRETIDDAEELLKHLKKQL